MCPHLNGFPPSLNPWQFPLLSDTLAVSPSMTLSIHPEPLALSPTLDVASTHDLIAVSPSHSVPPFLTPW